MKLKIAGLIVGLFTGFIITGVLRFIGVPGLPELLFLIFGEPTLGNSIIIFALLGFLLFMLFRKDIKKNKNDPV
ncbi:hypothetical protein ACS127_11750 [Amphibacillus sp. Q70]|uniref:hypothetical protein n=1 Tax=Amphibacillus sp. Q70 TaxID=3453416 RepID=UPI003F82E3ED